MVFARSEAAGERSVKASRVRWTSIMVQLGAPSQKRDYILAGNERSFCVLMSILKRALRSRSECYEPHRFFLPRHAQDIAFVSVMFWPPTLHSSTTRAGG